VIELDGLTKRYGTRVAVEDLTVRIEPGRVTGFLGPNGSGKTTTMRCIAGLARPTAGSATVLDVPYRDLVALARWSVVVWAVSAVLLERRDVWLWRVRQDPTGLEEECACRGCGS
jgi:ABC-type multidrug transport system ATPase subunit